MMSFGLLMEVVLIHKGLNKNGLLYQREVAVCFSA